MTVRILSLFCRVRYQSANRTSSDIPADSAGEGALGRDKLHPRTPSFGRELGNAAKWRVDTSKAPGVARPCDVRRHPSKPARCTFMSDFGSARDLPTRTATDDTAGVALEIRISGADVEQHPTFEAASQCCANLLDVHIQSQSAGTRPRDEKCIYKPLNFPARNRPVDAPTGGRVALKIPQRRELCSNWHLVRFNT